MFATVPAIAARLADALGGGWEVSTGNIHADRRTLPRADVRLQGAALSGTSGPGVTLALRYAVTLCVQAGAASAFEQLDGAVTAAIAQLHHWRPEGQHARLQLQDFAEVDFLEQGLFGYELAFALTTTRQGFNQ